MNWGFIIRAGVWAATVFCGGTLIWLLVKTSRYGRPHQYTWAVGRPAAGVIYAFGKGMLPWEKESVAKHPLSFIAGIFYHLGIGTAFFILYAGMLGFEPDSGAAEILRVVVLTGTFSGLGLLLKRMVKPTLRQLSCPEDFLSNLVVDFFLLITVLEQSDLIPVAVWRTAAVLLLLYIPVSKIRHCFFFFYTRILFGVFFGRRGVYPGSKAGRMNHD